LELSQRVQIPVAPEIVWRSLNDPEILKLCLAGCEVFDRTGDDSFEVIFVAKIGPVKAKFKGEMTLSEVIEPVSYTISGAGKGGVAGFAKGSAHVVLAASPEGAATIMTYSVKASVGGKLAQIGSRLVNGAARKMANDFFSGFVRLVSGDENMEVQLETLES
jgi:carbon monoxide dehydrogenase subunit G